MKHNKYDLGHVFLKNRQCNTLLDKQYIDKQSAAVHGYKRTNMGKVKFLLTVPSRTEHGPPVWLTCMYVLVDPASIRAASSSPFCTR